MDSRRWTLNGAGQASEDHVLGEAVHPHRGLGLSHPKVIDQLVVAVKPLQRLGELRAVGVHCLIELALHRFPPGLVQLLGLVRVHDLILPGRAHLLTLESAAIAIQLYSWPTFNSASTRS
jgi:hypothetical protein